MMWLFDAVQRAEARVQFTKVYQWKLWHTLAHTAVMLGTAYYINHQSKGPCPWLGVAVLGGLYWEYLELEVFPHIPALRRGHGEDESVNA